MQDGYQNRGEIADEVGVLVDDQTTARREDIIAAINRCYQRLAGAHRWPELIRVDDSGLRQMSMSSIKTLEANEVQAPMPMGMGRLLSLHLQAGTSGRMLRACGQQEFFDNIRWNTATTGEPSHYTLDGFTAQSIRMPADSALTVTSSSSANDNNLSVRVYFRKSTGHIGQDNYADVTGQFSTGASVGGAISVESGYSIESVSIPKEWVGSMNVLDGSGNTLVAVQRRVEPPTVSTDLAVVVKRQLIRVWPVPDGDYGLTVTWMRDVSPLTEDSDTPIIPVSRILVLMAAADIHRKRDESGSARDRENEAGALLATIMGTRQQDNTTKIRPRYRNSKWGAGIWNY